MEKEKKKRGRKPKNVEKIEEAEKETVTKSTNDINDTIPQIIHIKKSQTDELEHLTHEQTFCEYDPNMLVPNAYMQEDNFSTMPLNISTTDNMTDSDRKTMDNVPWPTQTDTYCHWCCHSFTNSPVGIPLKYVNSVFYCTGNYCSFECAVAHNYTITDLNINIWERFNLLNLMAIKSGIQESIKCAKPRETLKVFGGDLDIETYRKNNNNVIYFTNSYPMISVSEQIEELCDTFNTAHNELFTIKKDTKNKQTTIQEFYSDKSI